MSQELDERADEFYGVQSAVATVNDNASSAVQRAAGLADPTHPVMDLSNTHGALVDTMQETRRALDRVEQTMDQRNPEHGTPTPRQLIDDYADRVKERYDGPVLNLALMLLDRNRREWLHEKPETNGAEEVRRHGLTESQRSWLDDLADAWREYGGE